MAFGFFDQMVTHRDLRNKKDSKSGFKDSQENIFNFVKYQLKGVLSIWNEKKVSYISVFS